MSDIVLSPEQLAIAEFVQANGRAGGKNLQVVARAGTGKTTLCIEVIPLMCGTVAYLVFNTKNSKEAKEKFAKRGLRARVGTFHSFGNRVLANVFPKAKLEGDRAGQAGYKKFDRIATELQIPEYLLGFVKKASSLAMQSGFGVFEDMRDPKAWLALVEKHNVDDCLGEDNIGLRLQGREKCIQEGCQFARKVLILSAKLVHDVYSFDDMLYLPLLLNLPMEQFDNVVVDEAQDSNRLRREFAKRMHKGG